MHFLEIWKFYETQDCNLEDQVFFQFVSHYAWHWYYDNEAIQFYEFHSLLDQDSNTKYFSFFFLWGNWIKLVLHNRTLFLFYFVHSRSLISPWTWDIIGFKNLSLLGSNYCFGRTSLFYIFRTVIQRSWTLTSFS